MVLCPECGVHHHEKYWVTEHIAHQQALIEGKKRMRERDGD